jgi:uncharacterized protein
MRLAGKVALVTGAQQGIGAAIGRALAAEGADVALTWLDDQAGAEAVANYARQAGRRAHLIKADVARLANIEAMVAETVRMLGVPDILVNNAGAGRWLYLDETEPAELATMTAVPYTAALLVTREFLPEMLRRRSGWIVTVNSPVSRMTWPGATGYAGARWALRGLTAALRQDLRGTGVGISEVVPGKVLSDYFADNPGAEERIPKIDALLPAQTPEQVARAVALAVARERREVLLPWPLRVADLAGRFTPRLLEKIVAVTGHQR